jgi:60 kDa SS-A/Ro ribonucleoprotein
MSSVNRRIRDSISIDRMLRRVTLATMLFEKQFYVDGESNAELIKSLVAKADPKVTQALAIEARSKFKLRHVPLLLARELARTGNLPASVLTEVIQRPDEMGEFVAHYWSEKKQPLSNQVKKGLAACFNKFNEYQLAKWDKNSAAIRVRDVMFLSRPKPSNTAQEVLFKRIADDKLVTPDTWEVALSGGADKRETFTRLMDEGKLGALAFLRNLRNMADAGVSNTAIYTYASSLDVSKVLPFRFIAAARVVPQFKTMLETMMFRALADMPKLTGKTRVIVDVSGSMFGTKISDKSDLERFDAAAALAVMCRELCEEVEVYSFSTNAMRVSNQYRGFDLVEAIRNSQGHGGTNLHTAMSTITRGSVANRDIVFTDEQSVRKPDAPQGRGYVINVSSYKNGIDHKDWIEINGFSEAVFDYIREYESGSF